VTSHIPDKGQVMIRYCGLYANAHRGKMSKEGVSPSHPPIIEEEERFVPSKGWAEMILFGCFRRFVSTLWLLTLLFFL